MNMYWTNDHHQVKVAFRMRYAVTKRHLQSAMSFMNEFNQHTEYFQRIQHGISFHIYYELLFLPYPW